MCIALFENARAKLAHIDTRLGSRKRQRCEQRTLNKRQRREQHTLNKRQRREQYTLNERQRREFLSSKPSVGQTARGAA